MISDGKYIKNDAEFSENNNNEMVWTISETKTEEEKVYTYDEAINLTGNGWYNISQLFTLVFAIQAMVLDMFGLSVVVSACSCDLQLDRGQTSFLLSVPLLGSIVTAYPWGYISDTQGRKRSLIISLWSSFIIASLSAFSPNWVVLAVLRFFTSSLSSGAQSAAYTLLAESCCVTVNSVYMIILSSSLMIGPGIYTAHGYVILGLDFTYDLGYIVFKPWRLLILTLAATLGISAVLVSFYYESPKFLVNMEKIEEAIEILKKIKKWNRKHGIYPVKKIVLMETVSIRPKDQSLMVSLWEQTEPLFRPPFLKYTALLFYLTAVVYSVNSGFFLWAPILMETIFKDSSGVAENASESFCSLISLQSQNTSNEVCTTSIDINTLWTSLVQGAAFIIINLCLCRLAHRKKFVLVGVLIFCAACCVAMIYVTNKIASIILLFSVLLNSLTIGVMFSYFVDLYPTSYRGMISCLGVMVARISGLVGVNLIGYYIFTNCLVSLAFWAAYTFSGALMSLLLPPDKI